MRLRSIYSVLRRDSSQIRLRNMKWPRVNWVLAASLLEREQHVSLPINSTLWCRARYIDDYLQDWHEICYRSLWSPEVDSQWFVMTPWPFVQLYHGVKIPPPPPAFSTWVFPFPLLWQMQSNKTCTPKLFFFVALDGKDQGEESIILPASFSKINGLSITTA